MLKKILDWYDNLGISAKIHGLCTVFFITLIIILNVVIWFTVSYALYHPVQATIKYSINRVETFLNENPNVLQEPTSVNFNEMMVSGVVLRIFDERRNLLVDTNSKTYPSNEKFETYLLSDPPFFNNDNFDIARMVNALVYRAEIKYTAKDGKTFTLYFFRTITSVADVFEDLINFMIFIDIFSVAFAIFAGNIVSKKILKPIKDMTELAKKIASSQDSQHIKERIPLTSANDELKELAETFNMMLDKIQGDFSTIHEEFAGMQNFLADMQDDLSKQKKFVSDVSHELKTPLTVIDGYIDILEKYGQNAENKALRDESIEVIRDETQNIKNLLENLRFLARSEQNTLKFDKAVISLSDIVEKVFSRMKTLDKNHVLTLAQNDSAQIYADELTIVQMLRIFLDNAKKYTAKGGSVTLSSRVENNFALVQIADSGVGMAPENLDKIFERGVRLENGGRADGFGIGLSIAKMIADNHDIKIDVESKIGAGTTFTLKIPLVRSEE
ncbi:MAG: HAMP domain-containing histidine kinase [Selenomonadaceae bacterium]|nr:HAMP domain-containing histidine kinase [Selenomonadaceae bacterium]